MATPIETTIPYVDLSIVPLKLNLKSLQYNNIKESEDCELYRVEIMKNKSEK